LSETTYLNTGHVAEFPVAQSVVKRLASVKPAIASIGMRPAHNPACYLRG
jgi:hypothetical protein